MVITEARVLVLRGTPPGVKDSRPIMGASTSLGRGAREGSVLVIRLGVIRVGGAEELGTGVGAPFAVGSVGTGGPVPEGEVGGSATVVRTFRRGACLERTRSVKLSGGVLLSME